MKESRSYAGMVCALVAGLVIGLYAWPQMASSQGTIQLGSGNPDAGREVMVVSTMKAWATYAACRQKVGTGSGDSDSADSDSAVTQEQCEARLNARLLKMARTAGLNHLQQQKAVEAGKAGTATAFNSAYIAAMFTEAAASHTVAAVECLLSLQAKNLAAVVNLVAIKQTNDDWQGTGYEGAGAAIDAAIYELGANDACLELLGLGAAQIDG